MQRESAMRSLTPKFIIIKSVVLLLVNLFTFAIALLLTLILGSLSSVLTARLIASGVSGVLFYAYLFTAVKGMKSPDDMTRTVFVIRECVVGAVFYAIPLVIALIVGMSAAMNNYLYMFFMPSTFFAYLTQSPLLGYVIHLALYAVVVIAARCVVVKAK